MTRGRTAIGPDAASLAATAANAVVGRGHRTQSHPSLAAYAKNDQEDLDRRQLQILAHLVKSEFP